MDPDDNKLVQDQVLQDHYVNMQKALITAVDKELTQMESKLRNADLDLAKTSEEKTAIGMALYQANIKIDRMNGQLEGFRKTLTTLEGSSLIKDQEKTNLVLQLQNTIRDLSETQADLEKTRRYLVDSNTKIQQLTDLNASYTSDIKIQKRVQSKFRKELEISETKRKQTDAELVEEKRRNHELSRSLKEVMDINLEQKNETKIAQLAITKMNQEISQLQAAKKNMEKQWEESITAMAKRDQTLQVTHDAKERMEVQLTEYSINLNALRNQRDDSLAELREKDIENKNLVSSQGYLKTRVAALENELKGYQNDLAHSEKILQLYKQDLDQEKNAMSNANSESQSKMTLISNLRSQLDEMRSKYENAVLEKTTMEQARKIEEQERQRNVAKNQVIQISEEAKNANLRNEHANLKLDYKSELDELNDVKRERDNIKEQYDQINKAYNKLYSESKYLQYGIEKRQHQLDKITTEKNKGNAGSEKMFQTENRRLHQELVDSIKEKDRIQKMWMDEREESLKIRDVIKELQSEKEFLSVQHSIMDTVKVQTSHEIEDAKKEALDNKIETARLYIQLKKMQPIIEDLKLKNSSLEKQLGEARAAIQESRLDATTSNHMLQSEIRSLRNDRVSVQQTIISNEKSSNIMDRKYTIAKEMLEKATSDKQKLLKANFDLKRRADQLEAKLNANKVKEQILAKKGIKNQHIKSENFSDTRTMTPQTQRSHTWQSVLFSNSDSQINCEPAPSGVSSFCEKSASEKQAITEVPDFEAWRLKIESLANEREFLQNENELLKVRIEELSKKMVSLEKKVSESSTDSQKLIKNLDQKSAELDLAFKKYERAEKIAAHLEKQYKELRPNSKIDYYLLSDSEPSTQLLAALMAQKPPANMDRINTSILPALPRKISRKPSQFNAPRLGLA